MREGEGRGDLREVLEGAPDRPFDSRGYARHLEGRLGTKIEYVEGDVKDASSGGEPGGNETA